MIFVPANDQYKDSFFRLYHKIFDEDSYNETWTNDDIIETDTWKVYNKQCFVLAVDDNDQVIGFVCAGHLPKDRDAMKVLDAEDFSKSFNPDHFLYIAELAVDSKHRRRGIAQQLLQKCFQYAEQHLLVFWILQTLSKNLSSCSLYHKIGGKSIFFQSDPLNTWFMNLIQ